MHVTLGENELWREFDQHCNEMIITKIGRNLFPILEFDFKGLAEHSEYQIGVTMQPMTGYKLKWNRGRWEPLEVIEEMFQPNEVLLPKAKTGRELMNRGLKLDKLKLTNSREAQMSSDQMIRVQSMKQYVPILNVYEVRPVGGIQLVRQFKFSETKFIAVTAYQNERVKQLKVQRNKFAQGFREGSRTATKRPSSTNALPDSPNSTTSSESSETSGPLVESVKKAKMDSFGDSYQFNGTQFSGDFSPLVAESSVNWNSQSHPNSSTDYSYQNLNLPSENVAPNNFQNFQFDPSWANYYNQAHQAFPQSYNYGNQFGWPHQWSG